MYSMILTTGKMVIILIRVRVVYFKKRSRSHTHTQTFINMYFVHILNDKNDTVTNTEHLEIMNCSFQDNQHRIIRKMH